jgi:hypothetical protein
MASESRKKDQPASQNETGVKRRGLLRFGTLITALTGASAISAFSANSAQAGPGDKTPPSTYVPISEKGAPAGVATLDATSKIPPAQLPDLSASFVPQPAVAPTGTVSLYKQDASGVAGWTTPNRLVADALGWAIVTDKQYAGGADATGAIDSSAAFIAAVATGKTVYVPSGTYAYNADGIDYSSPAIVGAGRNSVTINIAAGKHLIDSNQIWFRLQLEGVRTVGGQGVVRNRFTGTNVQGRFSVIDNEFNSYTGACISHNAADMPYWEIAGNLFAAANFSTSVGVALPGLTDGNTIRNNAFLKNRIHIKTARGGNNSYIENNDLIRFGPTTGDPRVDLWVVPNVSLTNSGAGMVVRANKFGNENLSAGDYRVLFSDESATGTYFGDKMPDVSIDSTGYVTGVTFDNNLINGAGTAPAPVIYSTTPNILGLRAWGVLGSTPPTYLLQYKVAPAADRINGGNILGPFVSNNHDWGVEQMSPIVSNDPSVYFIDPAGMFEGGMVQSQAYLGGSSQTGYVNLLSTVIRNFILAAGATKTDVADALGGSDAAEITYTGSGSLCYAGLVTPTTGKPVWIELDLAQGTASPSVSAIVQTQYTSNGTVHFKRAVRLNAGWQRVRFLWVPREASAAINLMVLAPAAGSIKIGQVRAYHASEPQIDGMVRSGAANSFVGTQTVTSSASPLLINRTGGGLPDIVFQTGGSNTGRTQAVSGGGIRLTDGNGSVAYGTFTPAASKASSYSLTADNGMIIASGASNTQTLPLPSQLLRRTQIMNTDGTNSVTIATAGGTINGSATLVLAPMTGKTFVSDGTNWWAF